MSCDYAGLSAPRGVPAAQLRRVGGMDQIVRRAGIGAYAMSLMQTAIKERRQSLRENLSEHVGICPCWLWRAVRG